MATYDAIVVGAGPNGLAAAIVLARAGWSVQLREAKSTVGGGSRSAELTLPGFISDVCSAIHPLGMASPLMRTLPLQDHGLEFIQPLAPLAHPFDDGTAAVLERSLDATGETLGPDARAYKRLMQPFVTRCDDLLVDALAPLRVPRHPFLFGQFGLESLLPARTLASVAFKGSKARGIFAGIAAHSFLPLDQIMSAAAGMLLGTLAHAVGWPLPRGGSQKIADAMASYLRSLGGEIVTDAPVSRLDELPQARAILFDVTPRQLLQIAGDRLPAGYRRALERYRYGPGVFKIDWALDGPIPWKAPECLRATTVHVGGTLEEIAASERDTVGGRINDRPFVLVAQQSLFDPTRAPEGKHVGWAYCHVPSGSTVDMTERIERQMERFAPGFRDRVLARSVRFPADVEQYNPNYIGGDIGGGVQDIWQQFTRPTWHMPPYSTPLKGVYLCSSSTPPGGGVHGMCGYHAAQTVLRDAKALPAATLHNKGFANAGR